MLKMKTGIQSDKRLDSVLVPGTPGHGSGEVRQLCVQSLVAYLLGPSWTKFKKGGRGVFNIEFR